MAYYPSANFRQLLISPYQPDRTERIGTSVAGGTASATDIGKPVKLAKDAVIVCADGDEIYGFIASVEAGTSGGYSVGGVVCDVGREMHATDEDGGLAVGDRVVAGTAVALGTAGVANVVEAAGTEAGNHRWQVVGIETDPSVAAGQVLIRKV